MFSNCKVPYRYLDMGQITIRECSPKDLVWDMDSSKCCFITSAGEHTRRDDVDPYPCYSHDLGLVKIELTRAAQAFPISGSVDLYIFSREQIRRSNAYCNCNDIYDYDKPVTAAGKYPLVAWQASIVLSGKRIPIHPAMTRYLVAHEYGHAVAWHIAKARGLDSTRHGNFYQDYATMRGCEYHDGDPGGEWHLETAEIFANDFRVLVLGAEEEFWPHPQAPFPKEIPALVEFWQLALREAQKETVDGAADTGLALAT